MPSSKPELNIVDYLQIFFRRSSLFLIPLVVVFIVAVIGSFFMSKVYESSTLVIVEEPQIIGPLVRGIAVDTTVRARLNTLREEILSWSSLTRVIRKLHLDKDIRTQKEFEKLVLGMRKNILVRMHGKDLIRIAYQGKEPATVQKVADTITHAFITQHLETKEAETSSAIKFVGSQLETYRKKLESSEKQLREFKEKNLFARAGQVNINLERLLGFESELINIGLSLKQANKKQELLKKQLSGQEAVTISEITHEVNPVAASLSERLVTLETELAALLVDCTEEHPTVRELRREISELRKRLKEEEKTTTISSEISKVSPTYQELQKESNAVEVQIDSLNARKQELEKLRDRYSTIAKDIPQQEQDLARLTRDRAVNEGIYEMLLKRLETARISQQLESSEKKTTFRIVDSARYPLKPIKPNKPKIALLGLFGGAVIGFGCIFLAEYMDTSFYEAEDAKNTLGLSFLGSISKIQVSKEAKKFWDSHNL